MQAGMQALCYLGPAPFGYLGSLGRRLCPTTPPTSLTLSLFLTTPQKFLLGHEMVAAEAAAAEAEEAGLAVARAVAQAQGLAQALAAEGLAVAD